MSRIRFSQVPHSNLLTGCRGREAWIRISNRLPENIEFAENACKITGEVSDNYELLALKRYLIILYNNEKTRVIRINLFYEFNFSQSHFEMLTEIDVCDETSKHHS